MMHLKKYLFCTYENDIFVFITSWEVEFRAKTWKLSQRLLKLKANHCQMENKPQNQIISSVQIFFPIFTVLCKTSVSTVYF